MASGRRWNLSGAGKPWYQPGRKKDTVKIDPTIFHLVGRWSSTRRARVERMAALAMRENAGQAWRKVFSCWKGSLISSES